MWFHRSRCYETAERKEKTEPERQSRGALLCDIWNRVCCRIEWKYFYFIISLAGLLASAFDVAIATHRQHMLHNDISQFFWSDKLNLANVVWLRQFSDRCSTSLLWRDIVKEQCGFKYCWCCFWVWRSSARFHEVTFDVYLMELFDRLRGVIAAY